MASKGVRPVLSADLRKKETKLRRILEGYGRVMVAYSGGTDSTLLLFEALSTLGADHVVAVTATSEIYSSHETKRARALCKRFKVEHLLLEMASLRNRTFCANDSERCYHCKKGLLIQLIGLAKKRGIEAVLEASQVDDRSDFRPGAKAVTEYKVKSPLQEAGLNKDEVRRLSRIHGLPTADLPAAACLASRIPYGTRITKELLARIDQGEDGVRALGFRRFRLRHHGTMARLEFDPQEMERAFRFRKALVERIEALGWIYVALDLRGYRQGSLNETVRKRSTRAGRASTRNSTRKGGRIPG